MKNTVDELKMALKKQLYSYTHEVDQYEIGSVLTYGDGIAIVDGLEGIVSGELVRLGDASSGMALNLQTHEVGVVIMEEGPEGIRQGTQVRRTGQVAMVPVGDALFGRVINPLGEPIDGRGNLEITKTRPIDRVAPGVMTRQSVSEPLQTGIKAIDAMIPIGRGQRELIIGDRQTGKTSIAIDTILNQANQNVYCIYVAIGQKNSTVAQLYRTLQEADAMRYTTIVIAGASDSAPLQYMAPYAGCAIAEEWMEQGKDVLIIYDDLSKHAVAYRAISLLLRRPPGREAYPGDVFYLHSRLLERAARLNSDYGGGSITALPIIETQAGDISAYIPTNVISITDGQIFLQTDLFHAGHRPAVDTRLSVSRVGGNAQTQIIKKLSGSLKIELAQYFELQSFSQFASSIDEQTRRILDRGERLLEIIKQPASQPLAMPEQAVVLFAVQYHYIDVVPIAAIARYQKELLEFVRLQHANLLEAIATEKKLTEAIEQQLHEAMQAFQSVFQATEESVA